MRSREEYSRHGQGERLPSLEPETEETQTPQPKIIRKDVNGGYLLGVQHNSCYCTPTSVCDGIVEVSLRRCQVGYIHASCGKCGKPIVVNSVGALQIELGIWDK